MDPVTERFYITILSLTFGMLFLGFLGATNPAEFNMVMTPSLTLAGGLFGYWFGNRSGGSK